MRRAGMKGVMDEESVGAAHRVRAVRRAGMGGFPVRPGSAPICLAGMAGPSWDRAGLTSRRAWYRP